jgi:hypothetical protein
MAIDEYSIGGYWWLLMTIILMIIGEYSIGGYWWLLITIGGYCWLLYVILQLLVIIVL